MQESNTYELREMLKQHSAQQLEQLLRHELNKEEPDSDMALLLLEELKLRRQADTEPPELTPEAEQAWQNYRAKASPPPKPVARRWLLRAAGFAVLLGLLVGAMSYEVEAEPLWKRLVRWTDSVIEFFGPGERGTDAEYVFRTEHPGLQQVYDTVTQLGVTQPVVPMWLPEGYELALCKQGNTSRKTTLTAVFEKNEKSVTFNIAVYSQNITNQYQKDSGQTIVMDIADIEHYLVKNKDTWVAIWTVENIECSVMIDCQEDEFYKVLRSIYYMEDT